MVGLVRANAFLQSLLVLVVVTMATPGLVGLDESDHSLVLLGLEEHQHTVVDLGAAPRAEAGTDVTAIKAYTQLLTDKGTKAKLPDGMPAKGEFDEFVSSSAVKLKGTESPLTLAQRLKLIAGYEAKQERKKDPEAVIKTQPEANEASPENAVTPEENPTDVYHGLLSKLSKKVDLHKLMDASKYSAFVASKAIELSSTEKGGGGSSKMIEDEIKRLKMIEANQLESERRIEEDKKQAEQSITDEFEEKSKLKKDAAAKATAAKMVGAHQLTLAMAEARSKAQDNAVTEEWVKDKEAKGKLREVEAEKNAVDVRVSQAQSEEDKAGVVSVDTNEKFATAQRKATAAAGSQDAIAIKASANIVRVAKQEKMVSSATYAAAKQGMANVREESDQISKREFDSQQVVETASLNLKKGKLKLGTLKNDMESKAETLKETLKLAKENKKAFDKTAVKATTVKLVVKIVSATHYCGMRKDTAGGWINQPTDFKGGDSEVGNQKDKAAELCDSKVSCAIQIPEKAPQGAEGCPSPGYVARFRCLDADAVPPKTSRRLLQVTFDTDPNQQPKEDEDENEELQVLKAQFPKAAAPAAASIANVQKLAAQLELPAGADVPTKEAELKKVFEAESKPGSELKELKLKCAEPVMSEALKETLDEADEAEKKVVMEKEDIMKKTEAVEEKVEAKQANAADANVVAKEEEVEAKKADADAEDAVAVAEDKVSDLKAKVTRDEAGSPMSINHQKYGARSAFEKPRSVATAQANADKSALLAAKADAAAAEKTAAALKKHKEAAADAANQAQADVEKEPTTDAKGSPLTSPQNNPEVKAADKKVADAKQDEKVKEEQIKKVDKQLKSLKSPVPASEQPLLNKLIDEKTSLVAKAARDATALKEKEADAVKVAADAASSNSIAEDTAVDKAKDEEAADKDAVEQMKAQQAVTTSPAEQSKLAQKIQESEAKLQQAQEIVASEDAAKQAAQKQVQKDKCRRAKKVLTEAAEKVDELKDETAKLQARLRINKSPQQIQKLASEVEANGLKQKPAKEAYEAAEAADAACLKDGSYLEQAVEAAQNKFDQIGVAIAGLNKKIDTADKIKDINNIRSMAAQVKLKQKEQITAQKKLTEAKQKLASSGTTVASTQTAVVANAQSAAVAEAVAKSPEVLAAVEAGKAAQTERESMQKQEQEVLQAAMDQAKERLKNVDVGLVHSLANAEKHVQKTEASESLIKKAAAKAKADAISAAAIKKRALNGVADPLAGEVTEAQATIKALGPQKRTASQKSQDIQTLEATAPESASCGKGITCCINSFEDTQCKVERKQKSCTPPAAKASKVNWVKLLDAPWQPAKEPLPGQFLSKNHQEGKGTQVSLETSWVASKNGAGSVLRLRVCGSDAAFEGSKAGCYPKAGAEWKFEEYFNSGKTGTCTMVEDLLKVSQGKLGGDLVKLLKARKASQALQDKANQVAEKAAAAAASFQQAAQPASSGLTGANMESLVTELLQLKDGETISGEALLKLGGSLSFSTSTPAATPAPTIQY